ncbi:MULTISPECIES: hypothetical protein, partial [unclassified Streptomyces]|uniref:hypothetical protein n=1 Tax=unclassified Streptomyces TaxID=2593676 RepID=UPI0029B1B607
RQHTTASANNPSGAGFTPPSEDRQQHPKAVPEPFLRQRLLTTSDVVVRPRTRRIVMSFEGTC